MSSSDTKEKISKIINQNSNELRRGPWTLEEDNLLINYITCHGEGRWNSLAKFAGLKRTGKSCRLRWLNYLKPDIKRGDLSPHEQILILELHSRWGNRWSKIAQHLPGRTDNEIKNYWRTRVQKQARQLKIDSNSNKFLDTIRRFWMPRLIEKVVEQKSSETSSDISSSPSSSISTVEAASQKLIASHDCSTVLINQVSGDNSNNNLELESNDRSTVKSEKHEIPVNNWNLLTESKECDKILCGESMEDDDDRYRVGFPSYDVQESLTGRHVEDYNWLEDEFKSAGFWNIDELWMGV